MVKGLQALLGRREPFAVSVQVAQESLLAFQTKTEKKPQAEKEEALKQDLVSKSSKLAEIDASIEKESQTFFEGKRVAMKDMMHGFVKNQIDHEKKKQVVWEHILHMLDETDDDATPV